MEWEDKTGASDSNNRYQKMPATKTRCNSNEIQPLLNNEDTPDWLSDTESHDSYNVSNFSGPTQGEYQSLIRQRLAIGGLILSDMFRCIAIRTVATWLPFIMLMFDPLYATQGKPKPDHTSKMLIAIPVVSMVIHNLGSVFCGIVSDAWIKKTNMMLFGSYSLLVGYCYISAMDLEIGVNKRINCTLHNHTEARMTNPSCVIEPLITAYGHPTETVVLVYSIGVALISAAHSLLDTLVPALAGDQVCNRAEVRKLYAWYYFVWKLGDTIAAAVCLGSIKAIETPSRASMSRPGALDNITLEMVTDFEDIALNLGIIVLISCILSTLLLSTVVCSKIVREKRPDVSIIVATMGIWRQAWQRRRERRRGEGFLSTATYRYGGDYPDNAVKERLNLGKFFIVLLCMFPTSYLYRLPTTNDYPYNSTLSNVTIDQTEYNFINSTSISSLMYGHIYEQVTSLLMIPIIYAFCAIFNHRCNAKVTLLHRLVAMQITMIISTMCFFLSDVTVSLRLTSIFKGISFALKWTAGYEITLFSAPRSMQATAMGMYRCIDGLTCLVQLIFITSSTYYDPDYSYNYYIVGIVLNFLSIIALILLQWKMRLGLS